MIQTLSKLLPASIKRSITDGLRNASQRYWLNYEKRVPLHDLGAAHVAHCTLLPHREALLDHLPKGAIVAEVGVDQGAFSQQILQRTQPKKLHLVDMWGDRRYHDGLKLAVNDKFADQIAAGQVEVNLGYSTTVVDRFAEAYFDWIYIDTDHSYRTTKLELEKYSLKVKPGGIIAGHDYIIGGWNRVVRYGVIEAVNEFCVTHHWEMIYLSLERSISPSFAIRKMDA